MDLQKIENFEIQGIDTRDYPDFTDAFLSYAEIKGQPLTDKELDFLNDECYEFVHELVFESLH